MENQGSHYDRLLSQLNEDMGLEPRDIEKEIRMAFENTDDGRSLDINEWDVVFEDGWKIVADIGSQWSVTETENAEAPFQFHLVEETNESLDENKFSRGDKVRDIYSGEVFTVKRSYWQNYGGGHGDWTVEFEPGEKDGRWQETPWNKGSNLELVSETDESQVDEEEKDDEKKDREKKRRAADVEQSDREFIIQQQKKFTNAEQGDVDGEKETTNDFLAGGKADDAEDGEFDPGQLRKGQHVELEHTDNPAVAIEIAKDHLREDPLYYDKLERMEKGECDHPEDDEKYARMGKKNPHE